jgi:hypothetical protein
LKFIKNSTDFELRDINSKSVELFYRRNRPKNR